MELLDNIKSILLSNENEELINILILLFGSFIEISLGLYLITILFNFKPSKKQALLYIFISSPITILSAFFIQKPYNTMVNILVLFIVFYFTFKMSVIKTFIASIFPSAIFTLAGMLLLKPFINVLHITKEDSINIPIYRISFSLLLYLCVFLVSFIFKQRNLKLKSLENIDKRTKLLIILNNIFALIYIIVQTLLSYYYINIVPIYYIIFNFISFLVYFVLSFCLLSKIILLVNTTQKLESAEAYNKTLHILHDSVRGFKHDFDNIVTTIGGYIQTNDMEGLKTYYSQLQNDCQKANNLYLLNPDIINNPGVYNLLTSKYNKAIDKNIKVNLTFLLDLNTLHMDIYEFARILGILLDNAIDAASECKEKILNITFRNEDKNHRNVIQIENTYKDKNVDLNNIFNKGISGKEKHTGLGLWEIKQFLKKNNNINLYTSKTDKYFSQQLEIYYE